MLNKSSIIIKTPEELQAMREGGRKLAKIKAALADHVREGIGANKIEELACELIDNEAVKASFKMVPGYKWATCVNVNEGVVHGIPKKEIIFKKGDIVSVDVGIYYKGFHTDTSFSVGVGVGRDRQEFLDAGKEAFEAALTQIIPGNRIFDISEAIEDKVEQGVIHQFGRWWGTESAESYMKSLKYPALHTVSVRIARKFMKDMFMQLK